ncbi:MAG: glycosyltransferase family 2 protein [Anaerolineae bacterium]|nr:glycosyltransferase family 2 protein [Anaerolineae bacterium]
MSVTTPPRTLVIVPAFNEEDSIAHVIAALRTYLPDADIAVINDGSNDHTGERAEAAGAIVLHLPHNVGIGAAVQTGLIYAAEKAYDIVLRSDGDGQHLSEDDVCRLWNALHDGDGDLVIGSRFIEQRGYHTPPARRIGIMLLSQLISTINGQPVTDPTSGFAAFNRRAIRLFALSYPHDYPEPEALVVAHRAGLRIYEIPVTMKPRFAGRSSITSLRSIYYMIKVTLAILIGLLRPALLIENEA